MTVPFVLDQSIEMLEGLCTLPAMPQAKAAFNCTPPTLQKMWGQKYKLSALPHMPSATSCTETLQPSLRHGCATLQIAKVGC